MQDLALMIPDPAMKKEIGEISAMLVQLTSERN